MTRQVGEQHQHEGREAGALVKRLNAEVAEGTNGEDAEDCELQTSTATDLGEQLSWLSGCAMILYRTAHSSLLLFLCVLSPFLRVL